MDGKQYIALLFLGAGSFFCSAILIVLAHDTMGLDRKVQVQQQILTAGVLGPKGREIRSSMLHDLATYASNPRLREILETYGPQIQDAGLPARSGGDPDATQPDHEPADSR